MLNPVPSSLLSETNFNLMLFEPIKIGSGRSIPHNFPNRQNVEMKIVILIDMVVIIIRVAHSSLQLSDINLKNKL